MTDFSSDKTPDSVTAGLFTDPFWETVGSKSNKDTLFYPSYPSFAVTFKKVVSHCQLKIMLKMACVPLITRTHFVLGKNLLHLLYLFSVLPKTDLEGLRSSFWVGKCFICLFKYEVANLYTSILYVHMALLQK